MIIDNRYIKAQEWADQWKGASFEQAHPWVVYDADGNYDARFSNEDAARQHAGYMKKIPPYREGQVLFERECAAVLK